MTCVVESCTVSLMNTHHSTSTPTIAHQAHEASVFFENADNIDAAKFLAWFGIRVRLGRPVTVRDIGRAFDLIDIAEAVSANREATAA